MPLNIFDDAILEGPESFILFLTIPANPVAGYGLGSISSTSIRILDNDGNHNIMIKVMLIAQINDTTKQAIHTHEVHSYILRLALSLTCMIFSS